MNSNRGSAPPVATMGRMGGASSSAPPPESKSRRLRNSSTPPSIKPSPRMSPSVSPLTPAAPLYHAALYPAYQVTFSHSSVGKHLNITKRRASFTFGYADRAALDMGKSGAEARGSEHTVELVWSVLSGKVQLTYDGREIRGAEVLVVGGGSERVSASWEMGRSSSATRDGGARHTRHLFKVVAHLYPVGKGAAVTAAPGPGNRQYDLFIDGRSFFDLPGIYQLVTFPAKGAKNPQRRGGSRRRPPVSPDRRGNDDQRRDDCQRVDSGGSPATPTTPSSSPDRAAVHGAYSFSGSGSRESVSPAAGAGAGAVPYDPFTAVLIPGLEEEGAQQQSVMHTKQPSPTIVQIPPQQPSPTIVQMPPRQPTMAPVSPVAAVPTTPTSPVSPPAIGAVTTLAGGDLNLATTNLVNLDGLGSSPSFEGPPPVLPSPRAGTMMPPPPAALVPPDAPETRREPQAKANARNGSNSRSSRGGGGMSLSDFASISSAGHARELRKKGQAAKEKKEAAAAKPVPAVSKVAAARPRKNEESPMEVEAKKQTKIASPSRKSQAEVEPSYPDKAKAEPAQEEEAPMPADESEDEEVQQEEHETNELTSDDADNEDGGHEIVTPDDEGDRNKIKAPTSSPTTPPADDDASELRRIGGGGRLPPREVGGESANLRHVPPPPSPKLPVVGDAGPFDGPEHGLHLPPSRTPKPRGGPIDQSWLRPAPPKSPKKSAEPTDESYLLNHAKCALCCRDASDVMVDCQCGMKCGRRAHAACLMGGNRSNYVTSVSHPCTPAPVLPTVLCGGIFAKR